MAPTITRPNNEIFVSCPKCSGTILERKKYFRAYKDPITTKPIEHHSIDIYICANCSSPIVEKEPSENTRKSILSELWPDKTLKDLLFAERKIDVNTLTDAIKKSITRRSKLTGQILDMGEKIMGKKSDDSDPDIK